MREFLKKVLSKIWPFSLFMRRIRELYEKNDTLQKQVDTKTSKLQETSQKLEKMSQENSILHQELQKISQDRDTLYQQLQEMTQKRDDLDQEIHSIKNSGVYRTWAKIVEAHHTDYNISKSNEVTNSASFWDKHYRDGEDSGTGSYGRLAQFKSEVVNEFLKEKEIVSALEIGCGDGNQLKMINYKDYTGVDVSKTIVDYNRENFKGDASKRFFYSPEERELYTGGGYDLAISMDVIFHLLEDDVFHQYMDDLFTLSNKYVVIYASNHEEYTLWPEYRHRNFTGYVTEHFPNWKLIRYIPNKYPYQIGQEGETSASDFYIFQRQEI